jgi:hypothetical protein
MSVPQDSIDTRGMLGVADVMSCWKTPSPFKYLFHTSNERILRGKPSCIAHSRVAKHQTKPQGVKLRCATKFQSDWCSPSVPGFPSKHRTKANISRLRCATKLPPVAANVLRRLLLEYYNSQFTHLYGQNYIIYSSGTVIRRLSL